MIISATYKERGHEGCSWPMHCLPQVVISSVTDLLSGNFFLSATPVTPSVDRQDRETDQDCKGSRRYLNVREGCAFAPDVMRAIEDDRDVDCHEQ